jgi:hypothetical protein
MGFLDWLFGKTPSRGMEVPIKRAGTIAVTMVTGSGLVDKSKCTAIGNADPVCPYCGYRFDRMPQQKKKCPSCHNFFRSRTRPLDNRKVLIKEEELGELERQWAGEPGSSPFHLVNSNAVAVGKTWRDRLVRDGGSDVSEIGPDGKVHRGFKKWLATASLEERELIGDLILSSISTGRPWREVAKKLESFPSMKDLDINEIVAREIRFIFNSGNVNRFVDEGIKQGEWSCIDPLEERHKKMDGKCYDLDDPIWAELYIEGCSCSFGPVISGIKM